jgi:hypothetical protein
LVAAPVATSEAPGSVVAEVMIDADPEPVVALNRLAEDGTTY